MRTQLSDWPEVRSGPGLIPHCYEACEAGVLSCCMASMISNMTGPILVKRSGVVWGRWEIVLRQKKSSTYIDYSTCQNSSKTLHWGGSSHRQHSGWKTKVGSDFAFVIFALGHFAGLPILLHVVTLVIGYCDYLGTRPKIVIRR